MSAFSTFCTRDTGKSDLPGSRAGDSSGLGFRFRFSAGGASSAGSSGPSGTGLEVGGAAGWRSSSSSGSCVSESASIWTSCSWSEIALFSLCLVTKRAVDGYRGGEYQTDVLEVVAGADKYNGALRHAGRVCDLV